MHYFAMSYPHFWVYTRETVTRHQTKPNNSEFGEIEMKQWWNEKDYIGTIPEKNITKEIGIGEAVDMIYNDVMNS